MISTNTLILNIVLLVLLLSFTLLLVIRNRKQPKFFRFFLFGFLGVAVYGMLRDLLLGFIANEDVQAVRLLYAFFAALMITLALYLSFRLIYNFIKREDYNSRHIEIIALGYITTMIMRYVMYFINFILYIMNNNAGTLESLSSETLPMKDIMAMIDQIKGMSFMDFAYFLIVPLAFFILFLVVIKGISISLRTGQKQPLIIAIISSFFFFFMEQMTVFNTFDKLWPVWTIGVVYLILGVLLAGVNYFLDMGVQYTKDKVLK